MVMSSKVLLCMIIVLSPTFAVDGGKRLALLVGLQGGGGDREAGRHSEAGGGQPLGGVAPCKEVVCLHLGHRGPLGWVRVLRRG